MGFFDSLKKAAKDVAGDIGNIAKETASDIGASVAAGRSERCCHAGQRIQFRGT